MVDFGIFQFWDPKFTAILEENGSKKGTFKREHFLGSKMAFFDPFSSRIAVNFENSKRGGQNFEQKISKNRKNGKKWPFLP